MTSKPLEAELHTGDCPRGTRAAENGCAGDDPDRRPCRRCRNGGARTDRVARCQTGRRVWRFLLWPDVAPRGRRRGFGTAGPPPSILGKMKWAPGCRGIFFAALCLRPCVCGLVFAALYSGALYFGALYFGALYFGALYFGALGYQCGGR